MFKSRRGPREVGTEKIGNEGHNYNHRTLTKQKKNIVGICTASGATHFGYSW
jgi:hypothetical protein